MRSDETVTVLFYQRMQTEEGSLYPSGLFEVVMPSSFTDHEAVEHARAFVARHVRSENLGWFTENFRLVRGSASNTADPTSLEPAEHGLYANDLTSSSRWYDAAKNLLSAASLLKPSVDLYWKAWRDHVNGTREAPMVESQNFQWIYMMLCGMAIENMSKGWISHLLVRSEKARARVDGALPKVLDGHNLCSLVDGVDLRLDRTERELLHRLRDALVWRGRYPVPKRNRESGLATYLGEGEPRQIHEFIKRLSDHIGFARAVGGYPGCDGVVQPSDEDAG